MILSNGQRAGYRAYDTVLMMWRGSASDPEQRVIMKWSTVADHITGMIVLHEWLSPDEAVLPSVNEQLSLIGEAESKKDSAFVMPQDAIDYVLSSGRDLKTENGASTNSFSSRKEQKRMFGFCGESTESAAILMPFPVQTTGWSMMQRGFTSANCMMTAARQLICPGMLLRSALVS